MKNHPHDLPSTFRTPAGWAWLSLVAGAILGLAVSAPSAIAQPTSPVGLVDRAVETLRRAMDDQERWVKVHAAEALLAANRPEQVQSTFQAELSQFGSVPEYRIGIWRVLSRCAHSPSERLDWVRRIQTAMLDSQGPDQGHAAETLGKLGIPFEANQRVTAKAMVDHATGTLATLGAWTLALSPQAPDHHHYITYLLTKLHDPDMRTRVLAAYGLRFLGTLPTTDWHQLESASQHEPADSDAHVYMLSAALCCAPQDTPAARLQPIREALLQKRGAPKKSDRYELCETFAKIGTPTDLPWLEEMLSGANPLREVKDLPSPATDAALYDHPDNVDVRVAAAKAILQISQRESRHPIAVIRPNESGTGVSPEDWPWWRGYLRNGIAPIGQTPPREWSDSQNVLWATPIPGRGHGSATVVGKQVFIAVADDQRETQSVICFDRDTGTIQWKTDVHQGGLIKEGNEKTTLASSSVACDGERLFINFLNHGKVYTTALNRKGEKLWEVEISNFVVHQGFGASPAIYDSLVITSADHKGGGAIAALDRVTGKIVWKLDRPAKANYTSPIILHAADQDQLFLTGCDLVTSLDPMTGHKNWEIEGSTTECVTSTVTDGTRIFSSGGYPENHVAAIRADGSGKIDWKIDTRVYVPSLLVRDNYLYGVTDAGVAMCWKCESGETVWRGRLGGTFSSSPVLVNDILYATNEEGTTFLFAANPAGFELLGKNQLGNECFATPVFCGNRMYLRVASRDGDVRQEKLVCVGAK